MGTKFFTFGKENYSMEKEKPKLNPTVLWTGNIYLNS